LGQNNSRGEFSMKTVLLSQEEVKSLITMKEAVEICDKTFQGMGEGTVINPTKLTLDLGDFRQYEWYRRSLGLLSLFFQRQGLF
jgi:alanine dehydrogenase